MKQRPRRPLDYFVDSLSCKGVQRDLLPRMREQARPIKHHTFQRRCHWRPWAMKMGYTLSNPIEEDASVQYFASSWGKRRCCYAVRDGVEYIFVIKPRKRPCATPDLKRKVIELYRQGLSTREVASRLGTNKQTVYEWVRDAGYLRSKTQSDRLMNARVQKKNYHELEGRAVSLYQQSFSVRQIAALLDISRQSINRWLRKHGVRRRSASVEQSRRQRQASGRVKRIREARSMRQRGIPVKDIAAHFGVWPSTVSTWLSVGTSKSCINN